jgi:hypothetical protein
VRRRRRSQGLARSRSRNRPGLLLLLGRWRTLRLLWMLLRVLRWVLLRML